MHTQHHTSHTVPRGVLQDAGELAILNEESGQVRHRFAMVVAFDSEEALRSALEEHRCEYRDSQAIQERIHE
ncbi:hypothetical protein HCU01_33680 [Halomonas cupida]|uniref:Uncharacterized protein n=1 Tax=Halomonas cupida TaxID=44933 RepID=A0A1M7KGV0_9GAMM|nr:hypothetical protein [Halomonas cupida]GEN25419.1 hypothetical protein HCU01_33680 [Halomonas cupida]SHM64095.1 hypothetical protein SAMN05660971_03485 [Halomonas cupida]